MYNFSPSFCQNLYVYTILGVARGQRSLVYGNFVFGGLNMHNFRPFFSRAVNKNNLLGGQFLIFLPKKPGK